MIEACDYSLELGSGRAGAFIRSGSESLQCGVRG